jgi:hypothetical protein
MAVRDAPAPVPARRFAANLDRLEEHAAARPQEPVPAAAQAAAQPGLLEVRHLAAEQAGMPLAAS